MQRIDNLFLSVGAMKSATTWLYSVLLDHPDIYFTPEKELHYFAHVHTSQAPLSLEYRLRRLKAHCARLDPTDSGHPGKVRMVRNVLRWFANFISEEVDDDWYLQLFLARRGQKYCADFSNLTCLVGEAGLRHAASLCDNLKVLYVMRDPVERLWSHVKFHLQVANEGDALRSIGPGEVERIVRNPVVWASAEYSKIVRTLRASLGPEQLKIDFFELVHRDPAAWLAGLEDFLDIRRHAYPAARLSRNVNPSSELTMPGYFPGLFRSELEREIVALEDLGLEVPSRWRQSLEARA